MNKRGTEGKYFDIITKETDCDNLITNTIFDWSNPDLERPFAFENLTKPVQDLFTHNVSCYFAYCSNRLLMNMR